MMTHFQNVREDFKLLHREFSSFLVIQMGISVYMYLETLPKIVMILRINTLCRRIRPILCEMNLKF